MKTHKRHFLHSPLLCVEAKKITSPKVYDEIEELLVNASAISDEEGCRFFLWQVPLYAHPVALDMRHSQQKPVLGAWRLSASLLLLTRASYV